MRARARGDPCFFSGPAPYSADGAAPRLPALHQMDAAFARATTRVQDRADEGAGEDGGEGQPAARQGQTAAARLRTVTRSVRLSARLGLGVAAAVQLAVTIAVPFALSPAWPGRPRLLRASVTVLAAAWLPVALDHRVLTAASFLAASVGSVLLLLFWAATADTRALCGGVGDDAACEGGDSNCCFRCDGYGFGSGEEAGVAAWQLSC
eukprot:COSAG05_NODE_5634_length_1125_cov_3.383041_2_plen_207_part_01